MVRPELVIGRIPVLACLEAGKRKPRQLLLQKGSRNLGEIRRAAAGIPVVESTRRDLDRLTDGAVHQGVVLEADPLPLQQLEDWLDRSMPPNAIVVVLDGIEDPHNFGAIIRSAAVFGAAAVVYRRDRAAPLSPIAVKSAAGGVEYVDLIEVTNIARALQALKSKEFWVAGLCESADQTIWEADLKGRLAVVVGGEGKGLQRLVREHCDFLLQIPTTGTIGTLNASVSTAILLAECARQRRDAPGT